MNPAVVSNVDVAEGWEHVDAVENIEVIAVDAADPEEAEDAAVAALSSETTVVVQILSAELAQQGTYRITARTRTTIY